MPEGKRMSEYTDKDGEPLLFASDVEAITGWRNETIRHYATAGQRARRERKSTPKHMPKMVKKVRRTLTKSNGDPLVVWSPLWRQDHIGRWLVARGVFEDEAAFMTKVADVRNQG